MYKAFFKRIIDFAAALILLFIFLPFFILIALVIKFDSKGPVFFRQFRGGRGGKYFTMLKFRSMAQNENAEKKGFEPGSLARVTRSGKILRKTKLDELPQLLNVLKGDMSLVGPRPEVKPYIELYPEKWTEILSVRPGITDPASIKFRNEEEILARSGNPEKEYRDTVLPLKLAIYKNYVDSISFSADAKILFLTIFAVILNRNTAS
ncbi:MAG: hypothetical protein A2017_05975 [Lentisphaerae bacterium GWF2_44_16]|nr:MAG: hypothetical protein A2017_05975 [Lentisphaerae bacterium GWF2_44_16]